MTKILFVLFYSDRENNKKDIIMIDSGKHVLVCYTSVINSQQNIYLAYKITDGFEKSLSYKYV